MRSTLFTSEGTADPGNVEVDVQRETLLDFTGVDAQFLVEKATGQVVDQYRTVAGA